MTKTSTTFRSEFYKAYKQQEKIFNGELKEYNKELNVTLLCVSDPVRYLKSSCIKPSEADRKFLFRLRHSLSSLQHC